MFRDKARNIGEGAEALDNAYIPLTEFKDAFYPGRTWAGEFETKSEKNRKRQAADEKMAETNSYTTESI